MVYSRALLFKTIFKIFDDDRGHLRKLFIWSFTLIWSFYLPSSWFFFLIINFIIIVNPRYYQESFYKELFTFKYSQGNGRDGKLPNRNLPRFSQFLCHNPSDFEELIYYIRSEERDISGFFPFFLSFFLLAITWGHGRIPLWPEAFERCPGKRHPRRRSPSTSPPRPPPAPCPPRREFLLEGRLSGSLSTRSPHDPRLQSGQKTLRLPFSVSSRGLNE